MGKGKSDFKCNIIDYLADLKEEKNGYGKCIAKVQWGDNPVTLDIRTSKRDEEGNLMLMKGISLNDEEADRVVDTLLNENYGSIEAIKEALDKRVTTFTSNDIGLSTPEDDV